jgi:4-amino-4-deoxy-L-arabinose transferase-like glycosyltransferase
LLRAVEKHTQSKLFISNVRKQPRIALIGVLLCAVLVRLLYVAIAPGVDPVLRGDPLFGDAQGYQLLAVNLLRTHDLTWDGVQSTSYRMPGYPAFLALIFLAAGPNLVAVRLVQAVVGALLCLPVYRIARRLTSSGVGLLAALGIAVHPLLIYTTAWLYAETLFVLVLWLGLDTLASTEEPVRVGQLLLAAVLVAGATYVRPQPLILPGFALLIGGLLGRNRLIVKRMLFVQLVVVLLLAPWMIRNSIANGELVAMTTDFGSNVYGGNNDEADGSFRPQTPFVLPGLSEPASDRELARRGFTWILAYPGKFIRVLPLKLVRFFSLDMSQSRTSLSSLAAIGGTLYALYVTVAIAGVLLLCVRMRGRVAVTVITPMVMFVATTLIFFGGARFALPIAPVLLIGLMYGAMTGVARIRDGRSSLLAWLDSEHPEI